MSNRMPVVGDVVSIIIDGTVTDVGTGAFNIGGTIIFPSQPGVQVSIRPRPPAVGEQTSDYDGLPNGAVVCDEDNDDLVKVNGRWFQVHTGQLYPKPGGVSVIKSLPS